MTFPTQLSETPATGNPTRANEAFDTLAHKAVYGKRHAATSLLVWGYWGGRWGGFSVADGTLTLTDDADNYVVVAYSTGTISVSTASTNWDDTTDFARVYKITTADGVVSGTPEDHRAGLYGVHGNAVEPGGAVAAADVNITDTGGYYTGTDVEAALQEIGSALQSAGKVPAQRYTVELANTTDSDPGAGLIKFNNATPASATELYIDDSTSDGVDLSTLFASFGSTGFIKIQSVADAGEWAIFKWTATTDGTGYWKFTVVPQASKGTLDDADAVLIEFDAGGGGGSTQGRHAIFIAAGSMIPSVTGGCASLAVVASAANQPDITSLDFDATTQEYAQFSITMPKSWDEGTLTFAPVWSHAATTTNFGVVFDLQAYAASNDDAIATSFGTAQTSTDTGGTTNDLYVGPESSAITVAGTPTAEDTVFFRASRVTGNGSDTMAIDARLMGIVLYITTNADTDA
jgi:hypothetical protein